MLRGPLQPGDTLARPIFQWCSDSDQSDPVDRGRGNHADIRLKVPTRRYRRRTRNLLGCERATGSEQRAIARRLAKATKEAMTMRMEWLRAGDSSPACWACFIVFDGHVDVLAVIGPRNALIVPCHPMRHAHCGLICGSAAGTARARLRSTIIRCRIDDCAASRTADRTGSVDFAMLGNGLEVPPRVPDPTWRWTWRFSVAILALR